MTMYQQGDRVWLCTTGGEMLARLLDPDARSGMVIWLVEVEGGPRLLAREDQFRLADGADSPIVVEADGSVVHRDQVDQMRWATCFASMNNYLTSR